MTIDLSTVVGSIFPISCSLDQLKVSRGDFLSACDFITSLLQEDWVSFKDESFFLFMRKFLPPVSHILE
jgi:hypothetical protein